jgi:small multidrug resistance pump
MGWIYLGLAIFFELCGTFSMKESAGLKVFWPSLFVFVFYGLCLGMMTLATQKIELGIAYSVWAGLGTALVTLTGIFYYREPVSVLKMISIGLIIFGVIGLSWESSPSQFK